MLNCQRLTNKSDLWLIYLSQVGFEGIIHYYFTLNYVGLFWVLTNKTELGSLTTVGTSLNVVFSYVNPPSTEIALNCGLEDF